MRVIELPGEPPLVLEHLVLDLNGTLTNHGELLPGVAERLSTLARDLHLHLLTADTFGTADAVGSVLDLPVARVSSGAEKQEYVAALGPDATAAIGNGRNDVAMLEAVALAIAIIGPEGSAFAAVAAADIVCRSITEALDLVIDERMLGSTLRR
jgi:P-type E1-E2 ATPase